MGYETRTGMIVMNYVVVLTMAGYVNYAISAAVRGGGDTGYVMMARNCDNNCGTASHYLETT